MTRIRSVAALAERRHDVLIQRFADRTRFFGAIEHRDRSDGRRQRGDEGLDAERAVELDRQHADLRGRSQRVHGGRHGLGARPHDHDDAIGVGRAVILEELVRAPRERGEAIHRALHDRRRLVVEAVDRLAPLEEGVGVLRRPAQHRAVGRQAPRAVRLDEAVVDHRRGSRPGRAPRSSAARATCGTRRRSAGTARATRATRRGR